MVFIVVFFLVPVIFLELDKKRINLVSSIVQEGSAASLNFFEMNGENH